MKMTQIPWLDELMEPRTPPCVSIYQPLHRSAPPARENPVRFKNLLRRAEEMLLRQHPPGETRKLIDRIRKEVDTHGFWTGSRDGMAVFAAGDYLRIIETQQPVKELVVVADSFHVKPLIRMMQGADRYHILCFTQGQIRFLEGSRFGVRDIELKDTPRSIYELSGMTQKQQVTAARDVAISPEQASDEAQAIPRPGSVEQFIRAVDKGIRENYAHMERLPLILFAEAQYHPLWRAISRNPMLMEQGVVLNPDHLPEQRIRDEAWQIYQPIYRQRIEHLANQYQAARAHNMGSELLDQVAQAAAAGRVDALLLAENAHIPGRLDPASGQIQIDGVAESGVDDVLDDLAEMVLKRDGQVLTVPPDLMPTRAEVAAIYRY